MSKTKSAAGFCLLLLAAPAARAEEVVQTIDWAIAQVEGGTAVELEGIGTVLRIDNETGNPGVVLLARVGDPGVGPPAYAVSGRIRYRAVEGDAFLEMRSHFEGAQAYFSRTLAPDGPLAKISGDSDWRPFALPFYLGEAPDRPRELEINLHLTGRGTVEIGPLTLTQHEPGEDPLRSGKPAAWWSDRTGGLVGGIGGSLLGLVAAVLTTLVARGRAPGAVLLIAVPTLAVGAASLAAGVVAAGLGQPYAVFYPLLLGGAVACVGMSVVLVARQRRQRAVELRRMRILDAS